MKKIEKALGIDFLPDCADISVTKDGKIFAVVGDEWKGKIEIEVNSEGKVYWSRYCGINYIPGEDGTFEGPGCMDVVRHERSIIAADKVAEVWKMLRKKATTKGKDGK